jgi:hypothetical protein
LIFAFLLLIHTMKTIFTFVFVILMSAYSHGQLIINEVLYDPSNTGLEGDANGDGVYNQVQDEFIEFVNIGATDLNIFKYRIFDYDTVTGLKTRRHTIINATVPSNGALVVFGGGNPVGSFGGAIVRVDNDSLGLSLGNSGEIIILEDSLGNVLATFDSDALSNNPNESYTRNPDISGDFVQHGSVTPGKLFSPGTRVNGDPFNTVLFVQDKNQKSLLKLFPNPTSGKVKIGFQDADIEFFQVLDLTGKEVKSPAIQNQILDLSHLSNGLYQILVNSKAGQSSNRIMIAR